jgi:hypothetical protein
MEAVGHLDRLGDRLGRAFADAVGIGAGAVARDDLDTRTGLEPGLQGFGLPVV